MFFVIPFPMYSEDILAVAPPGATGDGTEQEMSKVRLKMSISLLPTVELYFTFRAHQGLWRHWRVELTDLILTRRWRDKLEGEVKSAEILHLHCLLPDTAFTRRRLVEHGRIELSNLILGEYRHCEAGRDMSRAGILHRNCMLSNAEFLHRWLKVNGPMELTDLVLRRHRHRKLQR